MLFVVWYAGNVAYSADNWGDIADDPDISLGGDWLNDFAAQVTSGTTTTNTSLSSSSSSSKPRKSHAPPGRSSRPQPPVPADSRQVHEFQNRLHAAFSNIGADSAKQPARPGQDSANPISKPVSASIRRGSNAHTTAGAKAVAADLPEDAAAYAAWVQAQVSNDEAMSRQRWRQLQQLQAEPSKAAAVTSVAKALTGANPARPSRSQAVEQGQNPVRQTQYPVTSSTTTLSAKGLGDGDEQAQAAEPSAQLPEDADAYAAWVQAQVSENDTTSQLRLQQLQQLQADPTKAAALKNVTKALTGANPARPSKPQLVKRQARPGENPFRPSNNTVTANGVSARDEQAGEAVQSPAQAPQDAADYAAWVATEVTNDEARSQQRWKQLQQLQAETGNAAAIGNTTKALTGSNPARPFKPAAPKQPVKLAGQLSVTATKPVSVSVKVVNGAHKAAHAPAHTAADTLPPPAHLSTHAAENDAGVEMQVVNHEADSQQRLQQLQDAQAKFNKAAGILHVTKALFGAKPVRPSKPGQHAKAVQGSMPHAPQLEGSTSPAQSSVVL